jgi:TonB family protein
VLVAQQDEEYTFPKERELISSNTCSSNADLISCTTNHFQSLLKLSLESYRDRFSLDTIEISIGFSVNSSGKIKNRGIWITGLNEELKNEIIKAIEASLTEEQFIVENYNNGLYPSWHEFNYTCSINPEDKTLKFHEVSSRYTGGTVMIMPLFPNTPRRGHELDLNGFKEQMGNHIKKHWNYPDEAMRRGIQGRVLTMFTVNKSGKVTDIKIQSPHPLLGADAKRIISELPTFQPGLINGKAVSYPLSFPISYRIL